MSNGESAPDKATSHAWELIGKVGLLIGVIIGIITLYNSLYPNAPRIVAKCKFFEIPERPATTDKADIFGAEENPTAGDKKSIKKSAERKPIEQLESRTADTVERLRKFIRWPEHVMRCEITNSGNREAKELVFDLPFNDVNSVKWGDKFFSAAEIKGRELNLGILRPNFKSELLVWAPSRALVGIPERNFSLTYSGGVGKVMFPADAYGWVKSLVNFIELGTENPSFIFLLLATTSSLIILIVPSFKSIISSRKKRPVPEKQTTADSGDKKNESDG